MQVQHHNGSPAILKWMLEGMHLIVLFLFGGQLLGVLNFPPEMLPIVFSYVFAVFLAYLVFDFHNAILPGLSGMAVIMTSGAVTLTVMGHHLSLPVLGFITGVLVFFAINEEFGTFDFFSKLMVRMFPTIWVLVIGMMIMSGVTAALFDEGTSVVIAGAIYGIISSSIMLVYITKFDKTPAHTIEGEILRDAQQFSYNSALSLVFGTNAGSLLIKLGHPLGLVIGGYAGWQMGYWLTHITPISAVVLVGTIILVLVMFYKSYAKFAGSYVIYRNKVLEEPLGLNRRMIVGTLLVIVLVVVQLSHESIAHRIGIPGGDLLMFLPWGMSVVQLFVKKLVLSEKIHVEHYLAKTAWAEIIVMFAIFFQVGALIEVGILDVIAPQMNKFVSLGGNEWQQQSLATGFMGTAAAILSGFLENLGVGVFLNKLTDTFGGSLNTLPIRLGDLFGSAIGGNLLMMASVAGIVGVKKYHESLYEAIVERFKILVREHYDDNTALDINSLLNEKWDERTQNRLHDLLDSQEIPKLVREQLQHLLAMNEQLKDKIPVLYWLRHSIPAVIVGVVISLVLIITLDTTGFFGQGIWYCDVNPTVGCIESVNGHDSHSTDVSVEDTHDSEDHSDEVESSGESGGLDIDISSNGTDSD